jgi:hypothetical protein
MYSEEVMHQFAIQHKFLRYAIHGVDQVVIPLFKYYSKETYGGKAPYIHDSHQIQVSFRL